VGGGHTPVDTRQHDPVVPPTGSVSWLARARANPALTAMVALIAVSAGWFLVNLAAGRAVGPQALPWAAQPASALLATVALWRAGSSPGLWAGRGPGLGRAARRFWHTLAVADAMIVLATISNGYDAVYAMGQLSARMGPVTAAFYSASLALAIWALCRLPMGAPNWIARLTVLLDANTIVIAAGVYIWTFVGGPAVHQQADSLRALVAGLAITIMPLVVLFGLAKVALSGANLVDVGALKRLGAAMVIGSVTSAPAPLLVSRPYLNVGFYVTPLVCLCMLLGGQRQQAAARRPERRAAVPRAARRGRRTFSVLPYIAIAATDALLFVPGHDNGVVPVGAVLLTGLVVARQLVAFRENGRLLGRLDHGASHDSLTQLANRVLLNERLIEALAGCDPDRPVAVILIDLDDFKMVNDSLGHGIGDALLVEVAGRLTSSVRAADTVARLGGDEFAVVLDGATQEEMDRTAERMLAALSPPVVAGGHELLVRASLGIADGSGTDEAAELLRRADVAMYVAKERGGSRFVHYTPELNVGLTEQPLVGAELRQAIDEGQLRLVYQPLVSLLDGSITGVEALVRWAHPSRGLLGPVAFIRIAERTGLIVPLGRWVLREACRQAARWTVELGPAAPARLNVNVSAAQLLEPGFTTEVAAALADSGLPAHRLTLEITETMAATLLGTEPHLPALRALGVRIALDDFGTGQSTLSLLQTCPVDELKLDRTFTQSDPVAHQATVAAAVAHLGQAFGLELVAEGVETEAQADRLRALGYRIAQGYHLGRPAPPDEIAELVAPGRAPVGRAAVRLGG
jgi:diguanylate cyclase (GGDEF)-like protein